MILSFVFFMGCQLVEKDNDVVNKGLEKGLYKSDFEDESPFLRVAYQSDNNEFNIDNVTLTFYYGASYSSGIQLELENGLNIPVFELYFQNYNCIFE